MCLDNAASELACQDCGHNVGAFLLDGHAVCAACLAIGLRIPTTDPEKLRAEIREREREREHAASHER